MTNWKNKKMKDEIRQLLHSTRPPRLEGVVKEAMMQPIRKQCARRTTSLQHR